MGDQLKFIGSLLNRTPPTRLFHYTTQDGLLGIIGKGELWATASQYLNDTSEFELAQEVARTVLSGRKAKARTKRESSLLEEMEEAVKFAGALVCVSSFSENGDALGQWRGYSQGATGYAIGFDPLKLREVAAKQNYILVPCIYDERLQFEMMDSIIQENLDRNAVLISTNEFENEIPGGDFGYHLNRYALVLKNSAFKEEAEWRLISGLGRYTSARMRFRGGKSTIVPYEIVQLADEGESLPVRNVVVGPTPLAVEARNAVRGLLIANRRDHKTVNVGNSVIPYRHW